MMEIYWESASLVIWSVSDWASATALNLETVMASLMDLDWGLE